MQIIGIRFQLADEKGISTCWFAGTDEKRIMADIVTEGYISEMRLNPNTKQEVLSEEQLKKEIRYAFPVAKEKVERGHWCVPTGASYVQFPKGEGL